MNRGVWILAAAAVTAGLGGCSGTVFKQFDVDGDQAKSVTMDARQRVLLVSHKGGKDLDKHVICAEPSPDAMVAVSKAFEAQASVAGKGDLGIGGSSSEALGKLAVRSQTVQLLRDGLYRACEAYLNGAIGKNDYNKIMRGYDVAMVTLLAVEALAGMPADTSHNVSAGGETGKPLTQAPAAQPAAPVQQGGAPQQAGSTEQPAWGPGQPVPGMEPQVTGTLTSLEMDHYPAEPQNVAGAVQNIMQMFYEYRRDVQRSEDPLGQVDALLELERKRGDFAAYLRNMGVEYNPEQNIYGMIRMFDPGFGKESAGQ